MRTILGWLAPLLSMLSVVPYLIDIIKQKTKPNIVSWITWASLTGVATAAAFAADEPKSAFLTLGSTIGSFAVVVLGLKYGIAKFSRFDALCQAGAIIGLILWLVFNSPLIAIIAAVTIDFIAVLPTLRHSWLEPGEETWQTFAICVVASIFTVIAITDYSVEGLLYPAYLLIANALIVVAVIYRRKKVGISLSRHSVHETLHE